MKNCEVCKKEIPEDYGNLLCDECYRLQEVENQRIKLVEEETAQMPAPEVKAPPEAKSAPTGAINGITNPNYTENPEATDKEQWSTNIRLFEKNGVILWKPTKQMYTFIKDYCLEKIKLNPQYPKFIWRPKIVDVGCGIGAGSNILSQEADFVWGIDKNANSIKFAQEAFSRIKNNIYYSSQVTFDNIDIIADEREFMKFDVVVAIEVFEHIYDYKTFLKKLIQFDKKKEGYEATEYFISTPNRNHKSIGKDKPTNPFHVREYSSSELLNVLSEFFNKVEFFSAAGVPIAPNDYETTNHTPLLSKCSMPKL